jgi:transcriptional regulator with XRE-family HTH domain
MAVRYEDLLARLPEHEQRAIKARGAELIREEATLRELREAHARSQQELAARLGVQQAAVSKLERRTDMYISTLRSIIRALGGELDIVARFPGREPVRVTQFRELKAEAAR